MEQLMTIQDRLSNPNLSKLERAQRKVFIDIVTNLKAKEGLALSVSCGDGIWDYLVSQNNQHIKKIIATDIVDCPVSEGDHALLKSCSDWHFVKVNPSGILPFSDDSFDFVFHQDVLEHTEKPYRFLSEQYRVLKKGGLLFVGTPNLFRPANIAKLILGKLAFPVKIGFKEKIGDYVHVQEFYEQQLNLVLKEVGFNDIQVHHCYFGFSAINICFSMYPKNKFGKLMSHFLIFTGEK